MTCIEKKLYLAGYMLQLARISRIKEMINANPGDAERLNEQLQAARDTCESIEKDIEQVSPPILSEILAQKYLCGRSLEEVADIMNYSKRQIERLHRTALEKFKE